MTEQIDDVIDLPVFGASERSQQILIWYDNLNADQIKVPSTSSSFQLYTFGLYEQG